MTHELTIQAPDGSIRNIPLRGSRLSIGRSVSADICFAEDTGLSRQHLALQRDGDDWTIEDLGSKNGTFVNGSAIKSRIRLRTGDRVTAGRLLITFNTAAPPRNPVVVFDGAAQEVAGAATYVTSLEGALTGQTRVRDAGARGAKQMEALIKAGRELARDRSLNELFQLILDLAVEAVGALRGVVMTLEGTELVVRASKGEGFRISFDRASGRIGEWEAGGEQLLAAGPLGVIWRAPTDNDGLKLFPPDKRKALTRWLDLGLDRAVMRLARISARRSAEGAVVSSVMTSAGESRLSSAPPHVRAVIEFVPVWSCPAVNGYSHVVPETTAASPRYTPAR